MNEYIGDDDQTNEEEDIPFPKRRKYRRVKRKVPEPEYSSPSFAFPGVVKLVLTEDAQRAVECVCGEDVTSENPWKYIKKEAVVQNIELNESSEFFKIKNEVLTFPNPSILIIYLPDESEDEDQYYFCLSIEAEERANNIISQVKTERNEKLNNTTLKTSKPWRAQGSAPEISDMMYKANRPLIKVEIETSYPVKPAPSHFKVRPVEKAKDGYIEILSLRSTYTNVIRRKIDAVAQATPFVTATSSQTDYRYPKNETTQYQYTYSLPKETKEYIRNLKYFAQNTMNIFDDSIYVNGSIDFFTSDYKLLVKDEVGPEKPQEFHLVEFSSFYQHSIEKGKVISAVSWHPMWTGIVAISYADKALGLYINGKSEVDEVHRATFEITPVHLWSIDDHLMPKLLLEIHRDVSSLSFCPYDENLLVGGCVNGQIILWDITNKLKQVEEDEILTADQYAYRIRMHSMMSWMKNTSNRRFVGATVVSQLQYSPISAITAVTWISPFKEIDKTGKIRRISEDEKRTSLQFSTTSLDGTIQFWDLRGKPPTGALAAHKKYRHIKSRPAALMTDVSPFKVFHRVLKPIFKVNVFAPNTTRHLPLMVVGKQESATTYVQKHPSDPNRKFDLNERIYFQAELKDNRDLENEYLLGSAEGDFFIITWEGYDYTSNEIVNKETATINNFVKFHDGPLVSVKRCPSYDDVVLTVGGKIFALWLLEFIGKPIIWRKCSCRYTHGNWTANRHSAFRMSRSDGYVEQWNFTVRSDRCQYNILRSGKWTLGSHAHPLPLEKQILGLCDYTSSFRLFLTDNTVQQDKKELSHLYQLLCAEAERKRGIVRWNEQWNVKNPELSVSHRAKSVTGEEKKQDEKAVQVIEEAINVKQRDRINADAQWREREVERMNTLLLTKRGLDPSLLEVQQLPLIKVKEESTRKQEKLKDALKSAPKIYEDTVAMMFADAVQKKPQSPVDPYKGGEFVINKSVYFNSYTRIAEKYEKFVSDNTYQYTFNWLKMAKAGRERRILLDGYNQRCNHKRRIIRERVLREKELTKPPTISKQESIQAIE
ncbi:hypothetical protein PPYR_04261 [Photinus pyralis]|uniref:WD repeat-containing protein 63 n=1 Tax=Photinus pyralis TaxID=7054 RepID=A0A5N4AXI4_PHOPY|nr:WD repeat-containing protein 63-like [Photinus pyralis]KAB0802075.1 hypothetical protein PPYR_04261 [Photinus pyralis]